MSSSGLVRRREGARGLLGALMSPGIRPLVSSAALGRLPLGMVPLGIILLSRQHGRGYSLAGVLVGAYTLGIATSAPLIGRRIDRLGPARLLLPLAVAFPAATVGLVLSIANHAPTVVMLVAAAAAGLTLPPLGAAMRALWSVLLPASESLQRAYALEATLQEIAFVVGPLLVSAIVTSSTPAAALLVAGGCACIGAIVFSISAPRREPHLATSSSTSGSALRPAGVRTILTAQLMIGIGFGAVEVSMPAFAERHGARTVAGLLIGAFAVGSVLGGVLNGTRRHSDRHARSYLIALGALTVGFLPLLVAWTPAVMLVLILVAGMPIAPSFAASYVLLNELGDASGATERFAWSSTSVIGGSALGTALGGAAIQITGYRASLALAALFALLATLLVVRRRGEFSARPEPAAP